MQKKNTKQQFTLLFQKTLRLHNKVVQHNIEAKTEVDYRDLTMKRYFVEFSDILMTVTKELLGAYCFKVLSFMHVSSSSDTGLKTQESLGSF